MKIWIDDQLDDPNTPERHTPPGWEGAKNFNEFEALIEKARRSGDQIEAIDFDNDLGMAPDGTKEMEGKDILDWLKENYVEIATDENIELKTHSKNITANELLRYRIVYLREHR